jgi:hypothetical protein
MELPAKQPELEPEPESEFPIQTVPYLAFL